MFRRHIPEKYKKKCLQRRHGETPGMVPDNFYYLHFYVTYCTYKNDKILLCETEKTECTPGSEKIVTAKNGRKMIKCKCAECRITKVKFVKSNQTGGSYLTDSLMKASKKMIKFIDLIG